VTAARSFLAANWKLNPVTVDEATALAGAVAATAEAHAGRVEVAIFPPFSWLLSVRSALRGTGIGLGAQDCYWEPSGAYTGEVSAAMLSGCCEWVIVGHSERRQHFCETDEMVNRKAAAALVAGLKVIVCVGERAEELDAGQTEAVVEGQLRTALRGLDPGTIPENLVVAYEPVWAIGTGRNAEPAHAGRTMGLVQAVVGQETGAGGVGVLYGGSVKAGNVTSYVELDACAGCLVGGASLKAEEFSRMIEAVAEAAV
jgi:triosephosphate isomerase (TIM)